MSRPLYSIILPVRNGGEYAKLCVKSVLAQSYPHFTFHILDNNSTDGVPDWIRSLNDKRIVIDSYKKDLTIEENWSRIKSISKNKYMTMIGHDDILLENYLKQMDVLIRKHPDASLYQSHFEFINAEGNIIRQCKPMPGTLDTPGFIKALFTRTIDTMGTGYMMRSEDYEAVDGISGRYPALLFADDELWIQLVSKGYLAVTGVKCFQYRKHQSVSQTMHPEKYHAALEVYVNFLQDLSGKDPAVKKSIAAYGHLLLMTYAKMLSHYLLRVPLHERNTTVAAYLKQYQYLAVKLDLQKQVNPYKDYTVFLAAVIDSTKITRSLFRWYKKISA